MKEIANWSKSLSFILHCSLNWIQIYINLILLSINFVTTTLYKTIKHLTS